MKSAATMPLKFAFYALNADGEDVSRSFSKWGSFDGTTLILHEETIPVSSITAVHRRGGRLTIATITRFEIIKTHYLALTSARHAERLKVVLDRLLSRRVADQNRDTLIGLGRRYSYREAECPHCTATILLSGMPETPQIYCRYCETLTTIRSGGVIPQNEHEFRICESCNLFSQPQNFYVFYFWFLVITDGVSFGNRWCCRICMRAEAWKMLFRNLLFVLGVPNALWQLARCYNGSRNGSEFRELDDGNKQLARGDLGDALAHYQTILERVPHSAGVKFNLGQGLLMLRDFSHAASAFEAALQDCANYVPACSQLRSVYHHLGEEAKLNELDAMWNGGAPAAEDTEDSSAAAERS